MALLYGNRDLLSKEWAITALVSRGCTDAQIAAELETTEQELKTYLERIFDKTGCWNRTEVALWYLRIGVQNERRLYDRRARANWETTERRKSDRRHPLAPSPRANEQHEVNLEE
jgi:DNA-binding CsgD family transcriptional regulator